MAPKAGQSAARLLEFFVPRENATLRADGESGGSLHQSHRQFSCCAWVGPVYLWGAWTPCVRTSFKAEKEKLTKNLTLNLRCQSNAWSR
jgi:hypothetical protein